MTADDASNASTARATLSNSRITTARTAGESGTVLPSVRHKASVFDGHWIFMSVGSYAAVYWPAYAPFEIRYITHATSGSACSTGFRKGICDCSAAGLPSRRPVARPSQKLPPT